MRYVAIISAAFFLGLVAILVAASNSKCDPWVLYLIGSLIVASSTLSMVAAGVHFGMSAAVELIEHGEVSALSRKINPGEDDEDADL